jgi:hypothetical protein
MTAIILQQTMKTDGQMENANSFLEQYLCHNKGNDFAAKMQVLASRLNKTWKNQKRWSKEGPYVRE